MIGSSDSVQSDLREGNLVDRVFKFVGTGLFDYIYDELACSSSLVCMRKIKMIFKSSVQGVPFTDKR